MAVSSAYETEMEIPLDEVTEILFTSGTTGRPKGAMLSQGGICASIHNTATGMDMKSDDVVLIPLPLNHSFGLRVLRSALYLGETIVLQNGFSFAREMQQNILRWKCNCMVAVTAGFELIQQQMGNGYVGMLEEMRYIEFSAGAVPVPKRRELIESLPNVRLFNTWGSTETGGGLFIEFSKDRDKIESAGSAINDIELAVVGDDGRTLPDGEYGRLAIKSRALMVGYYADLQMTAKTLHGEWLYTNDLARKDGEGFIYLSGRVDDVISVGGEKISPADIEKIISVQPEVRECACIGVDDPKGVLGQVPVVFIVPVSDWYDEKQIEEQIRIKGNGYMVPAAYVKLKELPRNYMGKIDRNKLKGLWGEYISKPDGTRTETDGEGKSLAQSVLSLITSRRSIRSFTDKELEKDKIRDILEAGRFAPSGHNMQTWRFTVIQSAEEIERIKNTTRNVAERCKSYFYGFNNPNVVIIVSNDRRNIDGVQDSSAAIENMLLMAHAHGLGACWMNSLLTICDEPEIRVMLDEYGISKHHVVYGMVAIGYAAGVTKIPVKKEDVISYYKGREN
jgi:long-chain acyl-CoA synthetase